MKRFIKIFVIESLALYLVNDLTTGLVFKNGLLSLFITAAALGAASLLIKPIVNILILPINIVTFGLFRWVSHAITFYLVDLVLEDFAISGFSFSGLIIGNFTLDPISIDNLVVSYIIFSFVVSLIVTVFHWIFK